MKFGRWTYIVFVILLLGILGIWSIKNFNLNSAHSIGESLDSLNHVCVYYNGGVNHVSNRNTTPDGYNLGLKFQCVEFVKRYYYERFDHKMLDSYGHAKDFFDAEIADGSINPKRNLVQFTNGSSTQPQAEDILVFEGTLLNRFGHVAIISHVTDNEIEIIQQNPGPFSSSRETISLEKKENKWFLNNSRILGWLRIAKAKP